MVEETSFESVSDDVEEERLSRLMLPYLTSHPDSPESNRSVKCARVAASSDAILGLQEARAGDAGIRMPAECAVCLQDFVAEDCIFRWLRVNHVSPLCRHALPTQHMDDEDEDYDQGNYQQDDEYYQQYYDEEQYYGGEYYQTACRSSRRRPRHDATRSCLDLDAPRSWWSAVWKCCSLTEGHLYFFSC